MIIVNPETVVRFRFAKVKTELDGMKVAEFITIPLSVQKINNALGRHLRSMKPKCFYCRSVPDGTQIWRLE